MRDQIRTHDLNLHFVLRFKNTLSQVCVVDYKNKNASNHPIIRGSQGPASTPPSPVRFIAHRDTAEWVQDRVTPINLAHAP